MQNEIGIGFLLISLFFPRFVLFFWWLTNNLPYNTTPFLADIVSAIIFPRILILVYIYGLQGPSEWFWIHMVAMIAAYVWQFTHYEENMARAKKIWESA